MFSFRNKSDSLVGACRPFIVVWYVLKIASTLWKIYLSDDRPPASWYVFALSLLVNCVEISILGSRIDYSLSACLCARVATDLKNLELAWKRLEFKQKPNFVKFQF